MLEYRNKTPGLQKLLWLTLLGLVLQSLEPSKIYARAADGDEDVIFTKEDAQAARKSADNQNIKDFGKEELHSSTVPLVSIHSIEPEQGPMTGK